MLGKQDPMPSHNHDPEEARRASNAVTPDLPGSGVRGRELGTGSGPDASPHPPGPAVCTVWTAGTVDPQAALGFSTSISSDRISSPRMLQDGEDPAQACAASTRLAGRDGGPAPGTPSKIPVTRGAALRRARDMPGAACPSPSLPTEVCPSPIGISRSVIRGTLELRAVSAVPSCAHQVSTGAGAGAGAGTRTGTGIGTEKAGPATDSSHLDGGRSLGRASEAFQSRLVAPRFASLRLAYAPGLPLGEEA
ncbi:hypothetical protein JHW43_006915 [Diplocarpon mali]|nr:hypothetical protein JHW43_006915 [Diplocarpon mali]